ncbi:MAG: hypothetical protein AB7F64_05240 [Gammaproteobacteria bacterium]
MFKLDKKDLEHFQFYQRHIRSVEASEEIASTSLFRSDRHSNAYTTVEKALRERNTVLDLIQPRHQALLKMALLLSDPDKKFSDLTFQEQCEIGKLLEQGKKLNNIDIEVGQMRVQAYEMAVVVAVAGAGAYTGPIGRMLLAGLGHLVRNNLNRQAEGFDQAYYHGFSIDDLNLIFRGNLNNIKNIQTIKKYFNLTPEAAQYLQDKIHTLEKNQETFDNYQKSKKAFEAARVDAENLIKKVTIDSPQALMTAIKNLEKKLEHTDTLTTEQQAKILKEIESLQKKSKQLANDYDSTAKALVVQKIRQHEIRKTVQKRLATLAQTMGHIIMNIERARREDEYFERNKASYMRDLESFCNCVNLRIDLNKINRLGYYTLPQICDYVYDVLTRQGYQSALDRLQTSNNAIQQLHVLHSQIANMRTCQNVIEGQLECAAFFNDISVTFPLYEHKRYLQKVIENDFRDSIMKYINALWGVNFIADPVANALSPSAHEAFKILCLKYEVLSAVIITISGMNFYESIDCLSEIFSLMHPFKFLKRYIDMAKDMHVRQTTDDDILGACNLPRN